QSHHQPGLARLRVRWTLPWMSRSVTIPGEHLLFADATSQDLLLGHAGFPARRIGVLGIALVVVFGLAMALTIATERLLGWAPARIDCAGGGGVSPPLCAGERGPL